MDPLREQQAAARGAHAAALMQDEALVEAFAHVEEALLAAWRATQMRDTDGRERYHLALTLLDRVRAALGEAAATGRVSEATLRDIRREPTPLARMLRR